MFEYVNKDYDVDELNFHLKTDVEGFISECESFYSSQIHAACDCIISQNKSIILLSGPSGSGKTTTSTKIRDELNLRGKIAHVVSLDDFIWIVIKYHLLTVSETPRLSKRLIFQVLTEL